MPLKRKIVFLLLGLLFIHNMSYGEWKPFEVAAKAKVIETNRETNVFRIFFSGAIRQFQKRISPIDGPRCSFTPTCSEYGRLSVARFGVTRGIAMTSDRLQRCNYCAAHYYPVENGRLKDPPEANVFGKHLVKE